MSVKGLEMLRKHMSHYDFNPDRALLLGNVLYYLKQAEGEVAELESENKKLREIVRTLCYCMSDEDCDGCGLNGARGEIVADPLFACASLRDMLRGAGFEVDG